MKAIKGDLLDITEGVICHQVNLQKVAGAGLALQIRNKWPGWYEKFRSYSGKLGTASLYWTGDHRALVIASLYAQEFYGKGLQTDYAAFENALIDLKKDLEWNALENSSIYFPRGIGAGLANGEWSVIEPLIERYFPNAIIVEKE